MKAQLLKGVIHTHIYIYTSHEYIYIVHVNNIEGERWIREEGGDLKVFEGEGERELYIPFCTELSIPYRKGGVEVC